MRSAWSKLALQESGRDYVLRPTVDEMSQTRAARELELGNIDFIWTGTSAEYEQRFRAVRIPVLRGLDGYRICVIASGAPVGVQRRRVAR